MRTEDRFVTNTRSPGPGDVIGGYRLASLLGRGGMGSVFRAIQLNLDRMVALKIMLPEYAARPGAAERFAREAKVSAALRHPNAIEVFDYGAADGYLYLAMELLEGTTLRSTVGDGNLVSTERTIELALRIAEVLVAAHARGIVHRDLKPENVFLETQTDGTERLVVVDFGLAFISGDDQLGRMTSEGMITGTPDYISPEQAIGSKDVGPASDLYALGCMMFEMLVGVTPFVGNPMRVLMQHTHGIVPTLAEVQRDVVVPRALDALVMAMLAKSARARPTAEEVRAELRAMSGAPSAERARDRVGLDGRAARMISAIRPPATEATTLAGEAPPSEAEVAVVGALEGELVMALATNGIRLFIVSPDVPVGGAEAIFAPGADVATLTALRSGHAIPIVTDASPSDATRVPALLRAGIDDVVMSPVRPEDLGRRLWKLVRRARTAARRGKTRS